ncbi:hypothetical protein RI367_008155 [Sorochytrium milnesiophthora]
MLTTPLITPPDARPPRPSFWYQYGRPVWRLFGITLGTTIVLHLAYEKLYFDEVKRRMQRQLDSLNEELATLDHSLSPNSYKA